MCSAECVLACLPACLIKFLLQPNTDKKYDMMDASTTSSDDKDDNGSGFSLPPSLGSARITTLPQTAYYIPDFISEEEEQMILDKVCGLA